MIVGSGRFGYAFWDVGFLGNEPARPEVDWLASAQLIALDSAGAASGEVAQGQVKIGRIDDAHQPSLELDVPSRLGFYRFDIQISDADGTPLGAYSEYLRVVAHSAKVRLGINGRLFRPGQRLATRPEEMGADQITYGADFEVERRSAGSWRRYPPMSDRPFPAYLGFAGPGEAGQCSSLGIPADTPAGHYRVVKHVGVDTGLKSEEGLTLTAPFFVTSAGQGS